MAKITLNTYAYLRTSIQNMLKQQFLALPRIFNMALLFFAADLAVGDEPVGSFDEGSHYDLFVSHVLIPQYGISNLNVSFPLLHYCRRILNQPPLDLPVFFTG